MQYILIQVLNKMTKNKEKLDYNLYNAHGEILYKQGQKISDDLSSILEFTPTYKKDIAENSSSPDEIHQFVDKFVREMLVLAVKKNVKKVLIEPDQQKVQITFVMNDVIKESTTINKRYHMYLLKKMKSFANIEEKEGYSSQVGSVGVSLFNKTASYRFFTTPGPHGESINLEVIELQRKPIPDLANLGLSQVNYDELCKAISQDSGIFIISGQNYTGKTTTLVSILKYLKKKGSDVLFFNNESVEYKLPAITQIPKENISDVNFNDYKDVNIFAFDDITDFTELKQILEIIPKNKLVISTITALNVSDTIKKLVKVEQQEFKVINSIIGVMSQKFVKKVCQKCKTKIKLTDEQIKNIFDWDGKTQISFYKGKGCEQCNKTGYFGLIPVHEIITVDDELKKILSSQSSFDEIKKSLKYKKLRYDAAKKAICGLVSLEELERI